MRLARLALVLLLVSAAGCVMARDGHVKPPAQWPLHSNQHVKKSIALRVLDASEQGLGQETSTDAANDVRAQAVKAYTESGLFSSVVTTGEPADIKADITLGEGSNGLSWSGIFSALTLTMIPGVVSEDVIANTTYKDRQQKVIGTIVKTEGLGSWVQFFLLFAMPFVDSPNTIMDKAQYDIHRATSEEAYRKGFF